MSDINNNDNGNTSTHSHQVFVARVLTRIGIVACQDDNTMRASLQQLLDVRKASGATLLLPQMGKVILRETAECLTTTTTTTTTKTISQLVHIARP